MNNTMDPYPTPDPDDDNSSLNPGNGIHQYVEIMYMINVLYIPVVSVALLLGLLLNLAVIGIICKNRNQQHQWKDWTQIRGLAITHLICCLFIPLYLVSAVKSFHAPSSEYQTHTCKLGSYAMFVNMFSTTLIITSWNLCWCVPEDEVLCSRVNFLRSVPSLFFPSRESSRVFLLSLFLGACLALPSYLLAQIGATCNERYWYIDIDMLFFPDWNDRKPLVWKGMVVFYRLLFGQLIPICVIGKSCWNRRRRNVEPGNLESRVLLPVTISHFICWFPLLWLPVLQLMNMNIQLRVITFGSIFCTVLPAFNSCICPVICLCRRKKEGDIMTLAGASFELLSPEGTPLG